MAVFKRPATPSVATSNPIASRPPFVRPPAMTAPPSMNQQAATIPSSLPNTLPKKSNAAQAVELFRESIEEGRITLVKLRSMSILDRHVLWRRMNRETESTTFMPILRREEVPKRLVQEEPSSKRADYKGSMWCCYCADWTVFEYFGYMGSYKCIGCGISTKDYYNRAANDLWKSDRY